MKIHVWMDGTKEVEERKQVINNWWKRHQTDMFWIVCECRLCTAAAAFLKHHQHSELNQNIKSVYDVCRTTTSRVTNSWRQAAGSAAALITLTKERVAHWWSARLSHVCNTADVNAMRTDSESTWAWTKEGWRSVCSPPRCENKIYGCGQKLFFS